MKKQCQTCRKSRPISCIPWGDAQECPYVMCTEDGRAKLKWSGDDCDDWRTEQEARCDTERSI